MCLTALKKFAEAYSPDSSVIIARSTGRVNLVGMHIEHRGGSVNPIAVKHVWLIAQPRNDDLVLVKNVESDKFPDEQFRISDCLPRRQKIHNWDTWCYDEFEKRKNDSSVTWSSYVRAAVLYFQHLYTADNGSFAPTLKGMNTIFYGNVPTAAGLSSSSAIVMAVTEAVMHLNSLRIDPARLIEHCGYAEWYVGTRGGCGDHAAIKFAKPNSIIHITAFPTTVTSVPLPDGYSIVIANSLIEAKKQASARNVFNSRIAAYVFGLMLIHKNFPQYAGKIRYLRDVVPDTLGIDEAGIYQIIKSLPVSASRDDILKLLPERRHDIQDVFRSHSEPQEGYKIRQVCLYGITECIRSEMVPHSLLACDITAFGQLMNASHDGDRVTKVINKKRSFIDNSYPDAKIDALLADIQSGVPAKVRAAALWRQGGGYNVSIPELDELVDIALASPGVIGVGLVGAGMGGSIAAIVESKYVQKLLDNFAQGYYRPKNLPAAAEIVTPVGGCCIIDA